MDHKCGKCGGDLVAGRFMTGAYLVGFMPLEDVKKFRPRYVHVVCDACCQCGAITNIRVEKPEILQSFRAITK